MVLEVQLGIQLENFGTSILTIYFERAELISLISLFLVNESISNMICYSFTIHVLVITLFLHGLYLYTVDSCYLQLSREIKNCAT